MRAELPSWPDTCHEVAAQLDELIATLAGPHRTLTRRQELVRTLTLKHLRRARHALTTADPTPTSTRGRADEVAEWLEQGEYLDPDDLEWPEP